MKYYVPTERNKRRADFRVRPYAADEHKMQALRVNVYRHGSDDCTNNGISSRFDSLLVIGVEGTEEIDLDNPPENAVWLCCKTLQDGYFWYLAPLDAYDCGGSVHYCNGGNFGASSDSRWELRYALPVFDRNENKKYKKPETDINKQSYEVMFICPPSEHTAKTTFENLKWKLSTLCVEIVKEDDWGVKRLAYEICGHEEGHYYLVTFNASMSDVKEFDSWCKNNENVLRHMIIRKGV